MGWWGGGLCDYCVTPVPTGLGFLFGTALGLGLGLMGLDLGLGLDNWVVLALLLLLNFIPWNNKICVPGQKVGHNLISSNKS